MSLGKLHYALIPIRPCTKQHGLYKMAWDEMTPWNMDLQNLVEEELGQVRLIIGEELTNITGGAITPKVIYAFEGVLAGYGLPAITEGEPPTIELVAIINRVLSKCRRCGCYHQRAAGCTPAFLKGKGQ